MAGQPNQAPPGWYPNQNGYVEWWDGASWGPVAPQQAVQRVEAITPKSVGLAYALLILIGGTGAHRLYLGQVGRGLSMLGILLIALAFAGVFRDISGMALLALGIMYLIDLISLAGDVRRYNERQLAR